MNELKVTVRPNGPYLMTGPLTVIDPTGQEIAVPDGKTVALCRCGHSTDKPFCSGAHRECGFQDESRSTHTFEE